ncbi:phosphatase PAP2 family protein [Rhodocytophaga aerolata]|uniref:Phosphatase PAP2 family protein n=1 Tax=Rhodocytophaga aerolata TaxID=455078 RepID=A0ABT8R7M0_9BACT|nr:phosphatase PAP2 family protein [Rhodocytophaga aerolata]MDO1448100.1 phosphatase PAP2 family protein [Rhodocytophaga aerolata]
MALAQQKNILARFFSNAHQWVAQSTWFRKFRSHYPQAYTFIRNRFALNVFTGFPLTILVSVFIINILTFSEIAENVIDSEAIVVIDQEVTHFLYKARNQMVGQVFYLISYLGSQKGSIIIGVLVSIILLKQGRKTYFVALWLVLLGVGLSVRYGKLIFHRVRPADVGFYEETNFSFPSGHSTTAMVLFGMLTYFLMRNSHSRKQRLLYFLMGLLLVLLVGFSRIYLGVHFLSDVLGGYLLGATWMIMGITVIEWLSYKKELRNIPQ